MVTSKVTSVVRINGNSTRRPPSAAHLISAILIANLELEFRVSSIRIKELKFSNRKFLAILRSASRILSSPELQVPSSLSPWPPSDRRLIENARLKFYLSPSRISQLQISNRERMAISHLVLAPASQSVPVTDHESLLTTHAAQFQVLLVTSHSPL